MRGWKGEGLYQTQAHKELDNCDDDHEAEGTAFAEGVVVDLCLRLLPF